MSTPNTLENDHALLEPPPEVEQQLRVAREAVHAAFGVDLEPSPAALSLLDELQRSVVSGLPKDERETQIAAVGCYFGEVLRWVLNGHWIIDGPSPRDWRIGLAACFVHLHPVGMAGECLVGCETDQFDGSFEIVETRREALVERLDSAPDVSEDEYYSLCGRLELLALVADWLVAQQLTEGAPSQFSAQDYRAELENRTLPPGADSHN